VKKRAKKKLSNKELKKAAGGEVGDMSIATAINAAADLATQSPQGNASVSIEEFKLEDRDITNVRVNYNPRGT
jgi:hypothetical protein